MQKYVLTRIAQALIALVVLSVLVFILARATGDPTGLMLPPEATHEDIQALRSHLGIDRPYPVQYWLFISHAARGDLGTSVRARVPVIDLLKERIPNSVKLAGLSMVVAIGFTFPLGIIGAVRKGTAIDGLATVIAVLGQALPSFWVGLMLMEVFAVRLHWLPASEMGGLSHYVLPAFTLGWFVVAGMMRLLRSSMLDVLDSEFIKMARAKGLPNWVIIWKHALRNALLPVVTFGAIYLATLITAAVVVEVVFAWPGIGRLAYEAIVYRDFPVIQAVVLTAAVVVLVVNLIVDMLYAYLDPRIRY